MLQPFNRAVMTTAGANLLTRAQAGELAIQFTRVVTGDGIYSPEEKDISALQEQNCNHRNSVLQFPSYLFLVYTV